MARMESTRSRDAALPGDWRERQFTAPTLFPDKSHRIKLSIHKYSIIRSAISPLFVIGRQFREYVYCEKKC